MGAWPAEAYGDTLWDIYLLQQGLDPATPMPDQLEARRAHRDGLTHCARCGGSDFQATMKFADDGRPAMVYRPQRCVGCGELRQADWPNGR